MNEKKKSYDFKINETPVDRLTLQEAQKLIDKTKERLVLFVVPNKFHSENSIPYRKKFSKEKFVKSNPSCLNP